MKRITTTYQGQKLVGWVERSQGQIWIHFEGEIFLIEDAPKTRRGAATTNEQSPDIKAPMPGKITKVLVALGEEVSQGQVVIMMEAMKMEYSLKAKANGTVERLDCTVGAQVALGQVLLKIKSEKS